MTPATTAPAELHAAAHWRVVDFVSDLHLHAAGPGTFEAWKGYMARTRADAVFILGDLFEVWVGDDAPRAPSQGQASDLRDNVLDGELERQALDALLAASRRLAVFVMVGNRDFLLGKDAALAGGFTLLEDPTTFVWGSQRWLLTHGDAWCVADVAYQKVRAQLRGAAWQQAFLAQGVPERRAFARSARAQSAAHQQDLAHYADVDFDLALGWMRTARAPALIHGHTHRPADQALDAGHTRHVLTYWDVEANPPRAGVLRLQAQPDGAVSLDRITPDQAG